MRIAVPIFITVTCWQPQQGKRTAARTIGEQQIGGGHFDSQSASGPTSADPSNSARPMPRSGFLCEHNGRGSGSDKVMRPDNLQFSNAAVPEPSTLALIGLGLLGLPPICTLVVKRNYCSKCSNGRKECSRNNAVRL